MNASHLQQSKRTNTPPVHPQPPKPPPARRPNANRTRALLAPMRQPRDVVPPTFTPVLCLFLVRHGETRENRLGIVQGTMDTVLNEEGICQAELVAEELKDMRFSAILSSDLKRCTKTAEIIAKRHPGIEVRADPGLRERCCGEREGMMPEVYRAKKGLLTDLGESDADFGNRIRRWWDERIIPTLPQMDSRKPANVLVVSHGAFLTSLVDTLVYTRCVLNPEDYRIDGLGNTSISRIDLDKSGRGVLRNFDWVGHLIRHERAQTISKRNVDAESVPSGSKQPNDSQVHNSGRASRSLSN